MHTYSKFSQKKYRLLCIPAALSILVGLPIAGQTQTLSTISGSGINGSGASTASNSAAQFTGVGGLVRTPWNGFFTTEFNSSRIRWIGDDGWTSTVAGNAGRGFSGDGGPFSDATFNGPTAIIMTPHNSVLIFDSSNNRVRIVSDNVINTLAGNGNADSSGDGGAPADAGLNFPTGGVYGTDGALYIVEGNGHRIRRIDANGITTIAGNGVAGSTGDGGPALDAQLNHPRAITLDRNGNLLFTENNRVRMINLTNGTISTVAGNGNAGSSMDSAVAVNAPLGGNWTAANGTVQTVGALSGIATLSDGRILITDRATSKIYQVFLNGQINTYAGNGQRGFTANANFPGGFYGNDTLRSTPLNHPTAIITDGDNNIYFSDFFNYAIRKFTPPPSKYDVPGDASGGVKWVQEMALMLKSNGCKVVDASDDEATGESTLTFEGPSATCVRPPIWSGAKIITDAGTAEMTHFGFEVNRLISVASGGGNSAYKVAGSMIGLDAVIKSGGIALGSDGQTSMDKSMADFAASPDSEISERTAFAQVNATPFNAFTRSFFTANETSASNQVLGHPSGRVAGTLLPAHTLQMPSESGVIATSPDRTAQNHGSFVSQLWTTTAPDESLLAFLPFQGQEVYNEKLPNLKFWWNKEQGAGFSLKNLPLSVARSDTSGSPGTSFLSPTTIRQLKEAILVPGQRSADPSVSGTGKVQINELTVSLKIDGLDGVVSGNGPKPPNRDDCLVDRTVFDGVYPRSLTERYVDPDHPKFEAQVNARKARDRVAYAAKQTQTSWTCATTSTYKSYQYNLSASIEASSAFKIEYGLERPFDFKIGLVPIWGTWMAGMWVGMSASGELNTSYGHQNTSKVFSQLGKPPIKLDPRPKPYGKHEFGNGNNGKIAFFVQPFLMASFGKVYAPPGEKQVVNDISKKLFGWTLAYAPVLKNGLFRLSVNLKAEPAFTLKTKSKTRTPQITYEACFSAGARLDALKGIIGDKEQIQFAVGWPKICTKPIAVSTANLTLASTTLPDGAVAVNFQSEVDNTEVENTNAIPNEEPKIFDNGEIG